MHEAQQWKTAMRRCVIIHSSSSLLMHVYALRVWCVWLEFESNILSRTDKPKKKEENTNQCDTVHMFYKPNARYSLICVSICAPNQNIVRDWTEVTTLGHGLWFFKKKKNKIIFMCRVCGRYMCISENPSTQEQERTPESENNNVNNVLPTTYDAMHVWAFLTENLVQQHRLSVRTECSKTIHKCRSCHVSHSALI